MTATCKTNGEKQREREREISTLTPPPPQNNDRIDLFIFQHHFTERIGIIFLLISLCGFIDFLFVASVLFHFFFHIKCRKLVGGAQQCGTHSLQKNALQSRINDVLLICLSSVYNLHCSNAEFFSFSNNNNIINNAYE